MRFAIMSFAHLHAEAYIHNLRTIPDVEFVGFSDEDAARGQHFAALYGTRWFDAHEKLLAEDIDGVVICSENARHHELAVMAAQSGAHVLSEKPLATTLDDAQIMLAACEKAGVQLMTAFPMRFSAPARQIKTLVSSGQLGQIYGCSATNQGQLPRLHTAYPRDWFVDKELAGGGAVTDHTVHVADLLRWYLASEVTEVYAELNDIFYSNEGMQVETGGLIMLTFENGAFASIDCSWSKPPNYPTWGGLTLEIVAENGLATLDPFKQTLGVYGQGDEKPRRAYWGSDPNQAMINEFVAAVRESRVPAVTGHDGYKAVEIVDAVYQSAATGQPVNLSTM